MKNEQNKKKPMYGDYIVLGEMLGLAPDTARMRYRRKKEDAIKGMETILESRRKMISSFIK